MNETWKTPKNAGGINPELLTKRQRLAGLFGNLFGFNFETGGLEQQGVLYDLAGFPGEVGREFEIGLPGEELLQQGQKTNLGPYAGTAFQSMKPHLPRIACEDGPIGQHAVLLHPTIRSSILLQRSVSDGSGKLASP